MKSSTKINPCTKLLNEYLKCVNKYSNTNVCKYLMNEYNKCILNPNEYSNENMEIKNA